MEIASLSLRLSSFTNDLDGAGGQRTLTEGAPLIGGYGRTLAWSAGPRAFTRGLVRTINETARPRFMVQATSTCDLVARIRAQGAVESLSRCVKPIPEGTRLGATALTSPMPGTSLRANGRRL